MSFISLPQYKNGWKYCTRKKCKWDYSNADAHFYNILACF